MGWNKRNNHNNMHGATITIKKTRNVFTMDAASCGGGRTENFYGGYRDFSVMELNGDL
jgi:hypothetical protein